MTKTDVLIVGQGLAGSTLAWRCFERGIDAVVVDRGGVDSAGRPSASRVAVGLLTPITGKRLTMDSAWPALRRDAERFYRCVETLTGRPLFDSQPATRLFVSPAERSRFDARLSDSDYAGQTALLGAGDAPPWLRCEHGGFRMPHAARLDVPAYLDATREWLTDRGRFRRAEVNVAVDLDFTSSGVLLRAAGVLADRVALCEGHPGSPLAAQTDLQAAKGEILRVAIAGEPLPGVAHRGLWIAPLIGGPSNQCWAGATYDWGSEDTRPTASGRRRLVEQLAAVCSAPFEVLDQAAAIRPTTSDREPLAAVLPGNPRVAVLNGLGSKGVLHAPRAAAELAERLRVGAD